ncbi:MAG: hypothetical protein KBS64_02350 [Treponema sp.]|nr:hypothetical protein [Candidatus Treponema equi]
MKVHESNEILSDAFWLSKKYYNVKSAELKSQDKDILEIKDCIDQCSCFMNFTSEREKNEKRKRMV